MATTPLPRSIRLIQSPTVGQLYESGPEKGTPKPTFDGRFLGQLFDHGLAQVDEEALWPCTDGETGREKFDRTWHLLVKEYGMRDVTPLDQPPRYPLDGGVPQSPADAAAALASAAEPGSPDEAAVIQAQLERLRGLGE